MNFTREPIIETVITPREGCKLVVRNSKGMTQEDYYVDAIEVVSFGHSFFFRSQERPKSFLVPVGDYEVLELKETRMVLKNVSNDRSIKIGGGRDAVTPRREEPVRREEVPLDPALAESRPAPERSAQDAQRPNGKRDNKRRRGRRGRDRADYPQEGRELQKDERDSHLPPEEHLSEPGEPVNSPLSEGIIEETKAPSFISKLFPPPPTLIKESLSRYKPPVEEAAKPDLEETIFEHPESSEPDAEEDNEE